MRIEVIYALPEEQECVALDLEPGSKVREALAASGLGARRPQLEFDRVGIWGRQVSPDTVLREGDRVEIYRALRADPKEIRRKRAARTAG